MSPAKTAAERKADERRRHKDAGRVPVQVWVRPDYVAEVRALEAKLQRRERCRRTSDERQKATSAGRGRRLHAQHM